MYKIMHKDNIIALADDNQITNIVNKSLCPQCFVVGMPLYIWLDNRCVDIHRSHSRKLFKALRLQTTDDIESLISIGHGISITDNWWIQRGDESLDYRCLKSYNERIADIALYGNSDSNNKIAEGYSELGTVGSYEKAWRYENGSWYMYKQGSTQELISEYYSYLFLDHLCFDIAEYSIKSEKDEIGITTSLILSRDFTDNATVDFEPFCNYFADNEDIDYIINKLSNLPKRFVEQYVMIIFYDALLFNGDRHNQNIGFIRDSVTGEILRLAPSFDYNLGLIATGTPRINKDTGNLFTRDILFNDVCKDILKTSIPDRQDVLNAVSYATEGTISAFNLFDVRFSIVENYIIDTYDYIRDNIN